MTGLSRRQQIAIGLLIPFAIAGSTVATLVDERGDELCPDAAYDCAELEAGEPIVIGVVDATEDGRSFSGLSAHSLPSVHGRHVHLDRRPSGCSAEAAAEAVRELASDPPDEPPAVLVIAAACDEVAAPVAQILSDSGITLVMPHDGAPIPTAPAYHLVGFQLGTLEGVESALNEALQGIDRLAIRDGDRLLIPRTPLRDALVAGGYRPAT